MVLVNRALSLVSWGESNDQLVSGLLGLGQSRGELDVEHDVEVATGLDIVCIANHIAVITL